MSIAEHKSRAIVAHGLEPNSPLISPHDFESLVVLGSEGCAALIAERQATGADRYDEVWEGQYRMSPQPNNKHYRIGDALYRILAEVYDGTEAIVQTGGNVSDRREGWTKNFRGPDLLVVLPNSKAEDCGDYFFGGPDFVVEILSPGERPLEKLPFYAKVGTREVLHIDRDTKALALYRLENDAMSLIGSADSASQQFLTSAVVPLNFQVLPGKEPHSAVLVVQHPADKREWRIGS